MELSAEQRHVRDAVREVVEAEVAPVAAECDREERFPEDVWDTLADLEVTAMTVPAEYDGLDVENLTYSVVNEELATGMLALATALSVHCLTTSCIAEFASDAVKAEWLPDMATGRPVGAFCLSEPDAGSNPAQMASTATKGAAEDPSANPSETTASEDGDEWVLNGKKQWITNGERAGVCIVFAKVDGDDDKVTQFLVPKDTDGLEVGKTEEKLGLRASDTTALLLDDVRIPERYRLTEVGRGLSAALHILTGGRIGIASQAVGLAQAALDDATAYAQEREQFDQPLSDIQTIRHKLADMQTNLQAARLLTRDAARKADAGEDYVQAASMAKYFASEVAVDVTNEAVQIHGGYGYTTDFDVERYYRDSKITTIYEGTSEIQKTVIARAMLE